MASEKFNHIIRQVVLDWTGAFPTCLLPLAHVSWKELTNMLTDSKVCSLIGLLSDGVLFPVCSLCKISFLAFLRPILGKT